MSNLGFIGKMGIAKFGKITDSLTTALVQFDPESATEAQIKEMMAHVSELAARTAKSETVSEHDAQALSVVVAELERTNKAADILSARLASTTDEAQKHAIEASLNTLVDSLEKLTESKKDLEARAKESADDVIEWRQVHQQAVTQLSTARNRLDAAKRDMLHAQEEQRREAERAEMAKRDAGLKQGLDISNIGLSAMEQAAAQAKEKARADHLTTEALKASTHSGAEDIVAQALASAEPAPTSAAERLAALRAKAS